MLSSYVLTPNAANTCANALPGTMLGRNAGYGFDSFAVNARISRMISIGDNFRLEGMADTFNALNHRNDLIPNGTWGTGAYPSTSSSSLVKQLLWASLAELRSPQS